MPILTVLLGVAADDALATAVADELLDITVDTLHKRRDLTAVALQFVPPGQWFIGGQAGAPTAFVEIRISAGSNRPEEIAAFVAAGHRALDARLGLHAVSYVQVQEVPAAHWGWGGRTQAARAAAAC
ncbi:4-oxalocrotonate tautomerase [Ideonella sp. 4Y16]|uniref:4-oxalocrotonate tautomerase n=1 Tax=Ideonella alba TaxID=2824118 RepID=A0A940YJQ2_9BURK|nr:4-oxalocrotonate tautomerase [Ideonella alba]MBQ0931124.1 4-oxalocrotonate tautomerase [Ideonella alba]MBQ0944274.1 4-oxalocrotonate tautomerase [Ideonella alba]